MSVAVEATKNWVGKTSSTKVYLKRHPKLMYLLAFHDLKKNPIYDVLPILDTDGHMTNCTKNNLQKESN